MSVLQGRWVQWLGNGLAGVAVLLAIGIVVMGAQTRALQDKVTVERTELTKAQTLAQLDNSVVQLLAKTAAEKNDTALQALLARNGVTFQVESNAGPPHPPASTGASK